MTGMTGMTGMIGMTGLTGETEIGRADTGLAITADKRAAATGTGAPTWELTWMPPPPGVSEQ